MKRHTKAWKENSLAELKKLAGQYSVVALANIEGFPANLFQKIRKKLQGKALVKVSKTRIIRRMLETAYPKETKITEHAQRMCAIIFTNLNPFELLALIKKNKGDAPAKAGQIAPKDLMVPAGDTGLPPGPSLTELKTAGLKVSMQGPTIHIIEDKVVTKKGETISPAIAAVLSKLNIKPIKIGLNVTAVLEDKTLYLSDVLNIDEEQVLANFQKAYLDGLALALEIGFPIPETIKILVQKAFRNAKIIALKARILTPYTTPELVAQANAVAQKLKFRLKEEITAAKPAEEKKENKEPETEKESKESKKDEAKQKDSSKEKPTQKKEEKKNE